MAATSAVQPARRRYRSPLREARAADTRRAVIAAAHQLFTTGGWAATGMRDIATAAGVAIETVYAHFSSKQGVLRAVADEAVVGDDAPVALADRAEFRAIGEGSRAARVRATARLLTSVHVRTAPFARVLREAASTDGEIDEMLRATRERQRRDVARALELLVGRPPTRIELDGIWALASPEVYLLLVEVSRWTTDEFEAWVAATIDRLVPRS